MVTYLHFPKAFVKAFAFHRCFHEKTSTWGKGTKDLNIWDIRCQCLCHQPMAINMHKNYHLKCISQIQTNLQMYDLQPI